MKTDKTKIWLAMAKKCLSVAELVTVSGVPRPTVTKAINGGTIRPITAGKIARALGVDVTEILADE